jgi:phosphohistidine phosphatase
MKTLLLMRHAKSSWKEKGIEDHERGLNKRGLKDAPIMGHLLVEKELVPQRILCSSALRGRKTAELVAEASQYVGEITYLNSFYLAEPAAYLEGLIGLNDNLERVMIIGHNPGLEGLLQIFSHQVESLPTAAIAHIVLPVKDWADINEETGGDLVDLWRPRDLKHKSKK